MDPKQIPIIKDFVRDMISYAQDLEEYFSSLFFAFFCGWKRNWHKTRKKDKEEDLLVLPTNQVGWYSK